MFAMFYVCIGLAWLRAVVFFVGVCVSDCLF